MTATTREPRPAGGLDGEQLERLDQVVARSRAAADAFRAIGDQEAVDRIVWALVAAGLQHAVELARLAMEETGFGVFEDKVVKNYIATEFLYDYLKDKRSVGVIEEDPERAIRYVAEPVGVVLALTPITNPTSTVLFKAIVAAKTRNAMIFRPVRARRRLARCAPSRSSRRRASAPACHPARCRSSPIRRSTSRSTSSTTPASTSSGPPAGRRRSPRPTPPASPA